jgi:hypothetical protein
MYRNDYFNYEIKEWNGKPMMFWGKYVFDVSDTVVCDYVAYVMTYILPRLEDKGYIKDVIPLSYKDWDRIDPTRKVDFPIKIKGFTGSMMMLV